MRILMVHNFYQLSGGEDNSFRSEVMLLKNFGHDVQSYTRHNDEITNSNRLQTAMATVWNQKTYRELNDLLKNWRPDIVHFNNTFPLVSPAAYYAVRKHNIPIVQAIRNYRFSCVNALFHRDNRVCEDCLGRRIPLSGIVHRCYRNSIPASATVATMLAIHKTLKTYTRLVDVFVAVSNFTRTKMIQDGFPEERIMVKPNFLLDALTPIETKSNYALYLGSLNEAKGVLTLLRAWRKISDRIPLKIVGAGPLATLIKAAAKADPNVEFLGARNHSDAMEFIKNARMLIFPSESYETFGRVAMEAYAAETPLIASNIGAISEIVHHERTGLVFEPGDDQALAGHALRLLEDQKLYRELQQNAKTEFLNKYTAPKNHEHFMHIYEMALKRHSTKTSKKNNS